MPPRLMIKHGIDTLASGILRRMAAVFRTAPAPMPSGTDVGIFDHYESRMPSDQNAVDAVPGWSTALPPEFGVVAGTIGTFNDRRIEWAGECFGSLVGKTVLELGPLEAGHTMHLVRLGAHVTAIEANKLAYMRCLVAKEIVGLANSRLMLGDFVKWLETNPTIYDLIVASGVLYHMHDPLHLLDLIAARNEAVFLWTHYVTDEAMPPGDVRRAVLATKPRIVDFKGVQVRLYRRTYARAQANLNFNGGMADDHSWMHKDDMIEVLGALGYSDVRIAFDDPAHINGPALCVFARKSRVA